jgi:hypothetical protein
MIRHFLTHLFFKCPPSCLLFFSPCFLYFF